MTDVILDGDAITSESDLHDAFMAQLDFGPYYGKNLSALWDRLYRDIPRPLRIQWLHSELSREVLGDKKFTTIVDMFRDLAAEDPDGFQYTLE